MAYIYSMVCLFNYAILINLFLSQATFQKIKTETAPHMNGTDNVQRPSLPNVTDVSYFAPSNNTDDKTNRVEAIHANQISVKIHRRQKRLGETMEPLPAFIRRISRDHLQTTFRQRTINAFDNLHMTCHNNVSEIIYKKFPMATLFWELNTKPLEMDPSSMIYKPVTNELIIYKARPKDSGVYTCQMTQNMQWTQVIEIFVFQVYSPEPTIISREQTEMALDCHGEALFELFPGARRIWYHNGLLVSNSTDPQQEVINVASTKPTDAGTWQCHIFDNGRLWETANLTILTLPRPPLTQLVLTKPGYMAAVLILAAVIVMLPCLLLVRLAKWNADRTERRVQRFLENLDLLLPQEKDTL